MEQQPKRYRAVRDLKNDAGYSVPEDSRSSKSGPVINGSVYVAWQNGYGSGTYAITEDVEGV